MHKAHNIPPGIPPRARDVKGWKVGMFSRTPERPIRYGHAPLPDGRSPKTVVVILQGLSEFMEKYFEVMNELQARDVEIWAMDWMGQGGSGRYLPNLDKRHASRFQDDLDDLDHFMTNFVQQAAKGTPIVFMGHSMGAHMGFRYMAQHPEKIACAGFTAPLTGVLAVKHLPLPLLYSMETFVSTFMPEQYASQGDWSESLRPKPPLSIFSNDKKRNPVHIAWMKANPFLRVGGMTYKWVVEALGSCRSLRSEFSKIAAPCLVAVAGRDLIVDNHSTRALVGAAPNMRLLEIPKSCHEILMEKDATRAKFLNEFFTLLDHHGVSKPDNIPG